MIARVLAGIKLDQNLNELDQNRTELDQNLNELDQNQNELDQNLNELDQNRTELDQKLIELDRNLTELDQNPSTQGVIPSVSEEPGGSGGANIEHLRGLPTRQAPRLRSG